VLKRQRRPLSVGVPGKHHPHFLGRRLLLWLGVLAVLAAALLIHAGGVQQQPDPTQAKPQVVLVVIRGTDASPSGPGLAAFIAVIRPRSRDIGIVPVPGSVATPSGEALSTMAPSLAATDIAASVASGLGIRLTGYIVINASVVENVIASLQDSVPTWPVDLTPERVLTELGWPVARPDRKGQIQVISDLIQYIPMLPGSNGMALAGQVLQGTSTRLSMEDLFVLVTYVNDQKVVPTRLRDLPKSFRVKKVAQ